MGEPQDPPDFTDHVLPRDERPEPRTFLYELCRHGHALFVPEFDNLLCFKNEVRKSIFFMSMFLWVILVFYRDGCVCPIGSIQNVAQAVFDPNYVAPLVVIVFFFLPLLYSALFGRSYCASVCPHGAIQDVVLIKPIEVPPWIDHALGSPSLCLLGFGCAFLLQPVRPTSFVIMTPLSRSLG